MAERQAAQSAGKYETGGETYAAAGADALRRKRLLHRAWHRGIREMDLLLGRYAAAHIAALSAAELAALEHLMAYEDTELLAFFTGEVALPADIDHKLFRAIAAGAGGAAAII